MEDDGEHERMCMDIFTTIDSNDDGYINYGEFQDFMVHLSKVTGRGNMT